VFASEVRSQPRVVVEVLIIENEVLAHDALERRRLLDQQAAASRRLRSLRYRGLALSGQLLDVDRGVVERDDERRGYQEESEQE
jgi:hypothetical protein